MKAHGTLTLQQYLAALRLHYWLRPWVIGLYLLIAAYLLFNHQSRNDWALAGALTLVVLLGVIGPLKSRQRFKEHKELREPVTIELREDGLSIASLSSNTVLPWKYILKIRANTKMVLVYRTAGMFHVIPCEFFASGDDFEAFASALRSKVDAAT